MIFLPNTCFSSGDYAMAPKSNRKHAAVGSKTTLRCESPIPFNDCKFKAPNGEVHRIGIGGGSSYDRARVDCLCTVGIVSNILSSARLRPKNLRFWICKIWVC